MIQEKESSSLNHIILLSIAYFSLTLNHEGFFTLLPFVREEFILTRTQVGLYSTFYFISAALLGVFTGNLVDELGPKKGVLIGTGILGFTMLMYGLSRSYGVLLFLALFAGLGWSIITPSVNTGGMIATHPEKRAVTMGIMQSGMGFGGLAGASILPILGEMFGWRVAIQFSALFALIVGLLIYAFYQESNIYIKLRDNQERQIEKQRSFKKSLYAMFTNKRLFGVCVVGIIFGVSSGAVLSHYTVFLSEDLNISRSAAGLGLGFFQIGGIISRPLWGWASNRVFRGDRRQTLFVIGLVIGTMYSFISYFVNNPQISLLAVFIYSFLLGCSAFGWMGVHFVTVVEFAGDKQAGIATGLSLFFVRTGMFVAPPVFGLIADSRGNYKYSWFLFGILIIFVSSTFYYFTSSKEQIVTHPY